MAGLFAVIRSRGPAWDGSRPLEGQADWPAHAAFMNALHASGFVVLGGPLEGTPDVLLIVRAEDADRVRSRLGDDPWTASGHLRIKDVRPWQLRLGAIDPGPALGSPTMLTTRTLSVGISASPEQVYEFAGNPANLPKWAPGFVKAIASRDGQWVAETTIGEVTFAFAQRNPFGVLDHGVTLPSGESFFNPMRVVANGGGSEVLFTLFRHPSMTEAEFDRDARVVLGDLQRLKAVVEAPSAA